MGSWAEGCCISNLEIAPGDRIVVGFLKKARYDGHGGFAKYEPATPLLRGVYDDYGGCDVKDTDANKALFLAVLKRLHDDPDVELPALENLDNVDAGLSPLGCDLFMAREDALNMLRTVR